MKTKKPFLSNVKKITFLFSFFTFISMQTGKSQNIVDFDTLTLSPDSYWNGADLSGGFWCGEAFFNNVFVDWGGGITSWGEFAYSNKTDTVTSGYLNQYSAYAGSGYNHSSTYGIGYYDGSHDVCLKLSDAAKGDSVAGFYITNNSYAGLSMKLGDGYSIKFTAAHHDWFLLSIYGYRNGLLKSDSVNFYLADFRFSDSTQNYIVKDWRWVDLNSLGGVDSIKFKFSSSDNGLYGMNTPAYFCMDNLTIKQHSNVGISENNLPNGNVSIYPNPASRQIHFSPISHFQKIMITDISGKLVYSSNSFKPSINIDSWQNGVYIVSIYTSEKVHSNKILKY